MTPENIVYRFEGDKADVIVVRDGKVAFDRYFMAYQYSKSDDQWRFVIAADGGRYDTSKRNAAMAVARRRFKSLNNW